MLLLTIKQLPLKVKSESKKTHYNNVTNIDSLFQQMLKQSAIVSRVLNYSSLLLCFALFLSKVMRIANYFQIISRYGPICCWFNHLTVWLYSWLLILLRVFSIYDRKAMLAISLMNRVKVFSFLFPEFFTICEIHRKINDCIEKLIISKFWQG